MKKKVKSKDYNNERKLFKEILSNSNIINEVKNIFLENNILRFRKNKYIMGKII